MYVCKQTFTHSSFKGVVIDVVSATLRTGESKPFTVFVALFISQLGRRSQHAIRLLLSLVLLLSPELTGVQTCVGTKVILVEIKDGFVHCFTIIKSIYKKFLHTYRDEQ